MDNIKKDYYIESIPSNETYPWLLYKHYAHRIPSISYAFGLYSKGILVGVMTYGMPPCQMNYGKASFKTITIDMLELTRLVINDNLPANSCSYFISQTFKLLPRPLCLVSFADPNNNHYGYIYQATNWLYTGLTQKGGKDKQWIYNNREYHAKTITIQRMKKMGMKYDESLNMTRNWINNGGQIEENILRKHRYIYLLCNKTLKRKLLKDMKYDILPYPKGDNKKYDASYEPQTQGVLF